MVPWLDSEGRFNLERLRRRLLLARDVSPPLCLFALVYFAPVKPAKALHSLSCARVV